MEPTNEDGIDEHATLCAIVDLMDGTEWNADTTEAIARVLRAAGFTIRDVEDVDDGDDTMCANCGDAFEPENSDARKFATYCSRDCERTDEAALRSRGEL